MRRSTGLSLEAREVLTAAKEVVGSAQCLSAVDAVIEMGAKAISEHPLEGLLPEVRTSRHGLVFTFDAATARAVGIRPGRYMVDRLQSAAQGFRSREWESNLRGVVVWWLGSMAPDQAAKALGRVFLSLPALPASGPDLALLLGLVDWLVDHPDRPEAGAVLERALEVSLGRIRKAATRLASALHRHDLLAALADRDPDRGVRKRAQELLEACRRPDPSTSRGLEPRPSHCGGEGCRGSRASRS